MNRTYTQRSTSKHLSQPPYVAMSGYRDSYFQHHHLLDSHQVLYNEWNEDELPPPDEQGIGNNHLKNKQGQNGKNAHGADGRMDAGEAAPKAYNGTKSNINTYWDYFHDEDDWNLFKNVQLESNGVATFNPPAESSSKPDLKDSSGDTGDGSGYESSNAISGSIFNNKITRLAMIQNSNWNDLIIPYSE